MKLRFATVLACGFCLATASAAQQQAAVWSPPPTLKAPCRDTPESKTAWFDPNLYLVHESGVKLGRSSAAPAPEYAESARKANIQGTVLLALAINSEGNVDAVKVVCTLEPGLDQNAADAAKKWRFTPAMKDGKPVPVQIEVSTNFSVY